MKTIVKNTNSGSNYFFECWQCPLSFCLSLSPRGALNPCRLLLDLHFRYFAFQPVEIYMQSAGAELHYAHFNGSPRHKNISHLHKLLCSLLVTRSLSPSLFPLAHRKIQLPYNVSVIT